MKTSFLTLSLAITTSISFAQTLQDAIIKTDNERFSDAASDFLVLVKKDPAKGENYFYLGENYFKRGDIDSANIYYAKGAEVNATNALNYVGLGKVLLAKNNIADAKTQFFKAASVAQNKNAEVMRRTSEAWLATNNKNADEAINQANLAIKLDPKNAENYILLGDAQLEKDPTNGGSAAIKSYKTATTLNPKSARGILREGKLYQRGRNYPLALDKYKEAEAIDATYAPAYREKAELFTLYGKNALSIENWKKYLELNNSNDARYRFLSALFGNKQYADVIIEGENLKKNGYTNLYIERLMGYSYYEVGNKTDTATYTKGLRSITKFFELTAPTANYKYLPTDYKYKGLLLSKTGKDSLGVIEMEKAIALDPAVAKDMYSDIASIYMKAKKYEKVISTLERKQVIEPKLNNNDYFALGRSFYFLAQTKQKEANETKDAKVKLSKEAEVAPLYIKADSAFSGLIRLNATWPTAYMWHGRSSASIDNKNEKWLAKPFYEKVLQIVVKPEERTGSYKREVTESLEYLGFYHVTLKDKTNSDAIFNQLKELDPTNPKVINYFNPKNNTVKPGGK